MKRVLVHCREIERNDRTLHVTGGRALWLPVFIQRDDELAIEEIFNGGFLWQRDMSDAIGRNQREFRFKEVQIADGDVCVVALSVVERYPDYADIVFIATVDFFRLFQLLTALPYFDDKRVARFGHGASAPIA